MKLFLGILFIKQSISQSFGSELLGYPPVQGFLKSTPATSFQKIRTDKKFDYKNFYFLCC
ncbi:hypothetical protein A2818_01775 [Candidatus Nomurabacteria bacterium RIFCSPHIGHO2_01_FULL_40_12]|uniref:Uncharacterized protein n=1 Tax=Candidatus Nomurabacteria bacterium RIFCSPHIGHO2_01_FULL_40_12 TaxID=1801737 RepID=A0A1F6V0Q8_9BACT|nr:MAG: hypothetical protein A2818_01775 [Candidatus Nomurabacteria bacterium RIFCSPHIGHO2_01_FULL_40_12]